MDDIVWFETRVMGTVKFDTVKEAVTYGQVLARPGEPTPIWQCVFNRSSGTISAAVVKKARAYTKEE